MEKKVGFITCEAKGLKNYWKCANIDLPLSFLLPESDLFCSGAFLFLFNSSHSFLSIWFLFINFLLWGCWIWICCFNGGRASVTEESDWAAAWIVNKTIGLTHFFLVFFFPKITELRTANSSSFSLNKWSFL